MRFDAKAAAIEGERGVLGIFDILVGICDGRWRRYRWKLESGEHAVEVGRRELGLE